MRYILVIILFLFSTFAQAYFVGGNDLVKDMREWKNATQKSPSTNYTEAASYVSYIKGVYDAYDLNDIICPNNNVTASQVNAVVAKYLGANPKRWSEPAFFLVSDALKSAFPCSK